MKIARVTEAYKNAQWEMCFVDRKGNKIPHNRSAYLPPDRFNLSEDGTTMIWVPQFEEVEVPDQKVTPPTTQPEGR